MKFEGMTEIGEGETVPMSAKLSVKALAVLQVIAMFQGAGGHCDTTQEQMSQMLNMSLRSVGEAVKELKYFTYEGKPVIEVTTKKNPVTKKEQNVYILKPNKLFGVWGEKPVEESQAEFAGNDTWLQAKSAYTKETKITKEVIKDNSKEEPSMKNERMTNKQIVSYFTGLLKDKGIETKFSYPAVMKKMKTVELLFADLINNEIKKVCEVIVAEYGAGEIKSNLNEYPLNIHLLSRKWVVEKAINLVKKEKENSSQMKERSVEDNKVTISSVSRILGRKKKGGAI
jgi:hypothetical protein